MKRRYEKTCAFCGKKFLAALPYAEYCSQRCRHHNKPMPSEKTCAFCGKTFAPKAINARFCSKLCMGRCRRGYETLADFEKAQAERKATYNKRHERDRHGLTLAEIQEVIDAQDGDPSLLWKRSQSWTPAQRKYAKDRYSEIHNLFAATCNP